MIIITVTDIHQSGAISEEFKCFMFHGQAGLTWMSIMQSQDELAKMMKRCAHDDTIERYDASDAYADLYPGDLILLFLSETINKHNKVHLETEFYMHFPTTDYYYIPKDTINKAIAEVRLQLDQSDTRFLGACGLRPDSRRVIHYLLEQRISQVALKTKIFLDIWKAHSTGKTVSSTLSYKTMDSFKIMSS